MRAPGGRVSRAASPEPFLPDEDRREIARASGLVLPVREDRLDRERYLFYVCCSRAERLLVLSSRSSDEEGNPQAESFFVEDVRDLLAPNPSARKRTLSQVTWEPEDAPTAAELERALAATGPRARRLHRHGSPAPRCSSGWAPATPCPPARWRTSPTVRSSGWWTTSSAPSSWCPIRRRWYAGSTPTRCSSAPSRACVTRPAPGA